MSQPRSLLSIARLNSAKSRVRPEIWSRVLIAQTCFGWSGGFAPVSFPLFHGLPRLGLPWIECSKSMLLLPSMRTSRIHRPRYGAVSGVLNQAISVTPGGSVGRRVRALTQSGLPIFGALSCTRELPCHAAQRRGAPQSADCGAARRVVAGVGMEPGRRARDPGPCSPAPSAHCASQRRPQVHCRD